MAEFESYPEVNPRAGKHATGQVGSQTAFVEPVSWALRKSEGVLRTWCALAGITIGMALAWTINATQPRDSFLGRLFDFDNLLQSLVPIGIVCMFFWGIALCIERGRRLQGIQRASRPELLSRVTAALDASQGDVQAVFDQLQTPSVARSPLLRRIAAVLGQWRLRRSLQDAEVLLDQHVNVDTDSLHAGYSLTRTFVWALPVLGLVGTVLGIAEAVSAFSSFLGGNVEDVTQIKKSLVNVTGGLSFAFLITLLGLVSSLVLMLWSSSLQTREETLYADVQRGLTDDFLPALQRVAPPQQTGGAPTQPISPWLEQIVRSVLDTVQQAGEAILAHLASQQRAIAEQTLSAVRGAAEAHIQDLAARHGAQRAEEAKWSGALTAATNSVLVPLTAIVKTTSDLSSELQRQMNTVGAQLEQLERSEETYRGMVTETASALQADLKTVAAAVRHLTDAQLDRSVGLISDTLAAQSAEVAELSRALGVAADATRQVVAAQETLQRAINDLSEAGLRDSLDGLKQCLNGLQPVLDGLCKPIRLQLVAAQ